jgi:hypothetical protein
MKWTVRQYSDPGEVHNSVNDGTQSLSARWTCDGRQSLSCTTFPIALQIAYSPSLLTLTITSTSGAFQRVGRVQVSEVGTTLHSGLQLYHLFPCLRSLNLRDFPQPSHLVVSFTSGAVHVKQWFAEIANIRYFPSLSEPHEGPRWQVESKLKL